MDIATKEKELDSIWNIPKFSRFIIITPKTETVSFKEYSPFKISKALTETTKHQVKSVQKEGRSIVVEVEKAEDSEALLKVLLSDAGILRMLHLKNG